MLSNHFSLELTVLGYKILSYDLKKSLFFGLAKHYFVGRPKKYVHGHFCIWKRRLNEGGSRWSFNYAHFSVQTECALEAYFFCSQYELGNMIHLFDVIRRRWFVCLNLTLLRSYDTDHVTKANLIIRIISVTQSWETLLKSDDVR